MKITAILPDNLVKEVRQLAKGKNLTESLIIALREWSDLRHIKELNKRIERAPLQFRDDFILEDIRELNRRS